jgi:hypothetical protein
MVSWGFRAMSRNIRAMRRSFRTTGSFVRSPDVRRTLVDRLPTLSMGDSVRRRRSTAGSACGCSGRCRRRLRVVSVSLPRIERVSGKGVRDTRRAPALALVLIGAAGGFWGDGRRVVAVGVVLGTAAVGGSSGAASAFDLGLGLAAATVARLVSAVGGAVVGVEG